MTNPDLKTFKLNLTESFKDVNSIFKQKRGESVDLRINSKDLEEKENKKISKFSL